jgi:hypothetical protein
MKRSKPTTLQIGTLSEGTLKPEDLISAFLWDLKRIRLTRAERQIVQRIAARDNMGVYETLDDSEASDDLEELTAIIENHLPDYAYFGTLEGDGAHFGIWPAIEQAKEDAQGNPRTIVTNDGPDDDGGFPAVPKSRGLTHFLRVNDHGNCTLYRRAGTRWIEVWAVV